MYRNGSFVWFDLMTNDIDKAKAFYGEVFNWKIEKFDGPGDYEMIKAGEHTFGGYMEAPEGMPNMWTQQLSVDDVEARCEQVKKSGGKVMKEPFDIPTIGKSAVVIDPTGAALCLFQANNDDPSEPKGHGAPAWNELWTSDVKKTEDFFKDAFGFSVDKMEMPMGDYFLLKPGPSRSIGGFMKSTSKEAPPMWLTYFEVDNCDATVKKVKSNGGEMIAEAVDAPGVGRFAIFKDPTGAVVGCIQSAS